MRGRQSRESIVAAVVVIAFSLAASTLYYSATLEDAFITFRYSEHLSEGFGLGAWNTDGERVEGYTTFLWMLWLAVALPMGLEIATLAKFTGVAAYVGLVLLFLFFPLMQRRDFGPTDTPLGIHRDVYLMGGVILGSYVPLAWYATSGMETTSFALLIALCLLTPLMTENLIVICLVSIGLVLMRPEGLVFAIACNGLHCLLRLQQRSRLLPAVVGLFATVFAFGGITLLRLGLYGELLPNTYYAKVSGSAEMHLASGLLYLREWLSTHLAWVFLFIWTTGVCLFSLARNGVSRSLSLVFIVGLPVAFGFYIIWVGGDNNSAFPYWRHMLHQMPIIALALSAGLVSLSPSRRLVRWVMLVALILFANYQVVQAHGDRLLRHGEKALLEFPNLSHRPHREISRFLARISEPGTVIATGASGEIPFVVDAVHIDTLGLNNRYIARYGTFDPKGPIDSKTDMAYVVEQRPDIIMSTLSGRKIAEGRPQYENWGKRRPRREKGVLELLASPRFHKEYLFLVSGPYEAHDTALFLHRSFWQGHPLKGELHCVPISKTILSRPLGQRVQGRMKRGSEGSP